MEVEVYSCGCNIRYRQVDQSEFEGEPPEMLLVSTFAPCDKHKDTKVVPPPDAHLMTVMREPEKFLNE